MPTPHEGPGATMPAPASVVPPSANAAPPFLPAAFPAAQQQPISAGPQPPQPALVPTSIPAYKPQRQRAAPGLSSASLPPELQAQRQQHEQQLQLAQQQAFLSVAVAPPAAAPAAAGTETGEAAGAAAAAKSGHVAGAGFVPPYRPLQPHQETVPQAMPLPMPLRPQQQQVRPPQVQQHVQQQQQPEKCWLCGKGDMIDMGRDRQREKKLREAGQDPTAFYRCRFFPYCGGHRRQAKRQEPVVLQLRGERLDWVAVTFPGRQKEFEHNFVAALMKRLQLAEHKPVIQKVGAHRGFMDGWVGEWMNGCMAGRLRACC